MSLAKCLTITALFIVGLIVLDWIGNTFGAFWFWTTIAGIGIITYRVVAENDGWQP